MRANITNVHAHTQVAIWGGVYYWQNLIWHFFPTLPNCQIKNPAKFSRYTVCSEHLLLVILNRCCGSQIIGCYAPTGEHCEKPLEVRIRTCVSKVTVLEHQLSKNLLFFTTFRLACGVTVQLLHSMMNQVWRLRIWRFCLQKKVQ